MKGFVLAIGLAPLALLSGCGPSYILLELNSVLSIPDEADSVEITTTDPSNPSPPLSSVDFALTADSTFPLEVLLEPDGSTPALLRERVTLRLNGEMVARGGVDHEWVGHETSRVRIDLIGVGGP